LGLLGHTQANLLGVAQLATVGGVPLLSALVAAVNVALTGCLVERSSHRRCAAHRAAGALLGATLACAGLGVPVAGWLVSNPAAGATGKLHLVGIQPTLPAAEHWAEAAQSTHLKSLLESTRRALTQEESLPDVVIWPETSLTAPLDRDPALQQALEAGVGGLGVPVLLGAVRAPHSGRVDRYRNSVLWLDPHTGERSWMDKTIAVPWVEGAGLRDQWPWLRALLPRTGAGPRMEEDPAGAALHGLGPLDVLLCYEVAFPRLAAARRGPATLALVNLANDAWTESAAAGEQQITLGVFRAIEERLWLVRVADNGPSALIDPLGRVVRELPTHSQGVLRAEIPTPPGPRSFDAAAILALAGVGGVTGGLLTSLTMRRSS